MLSYTRTLLWRIVAIVAVALGLMGIALPILPTVPFLIVAAWAASKSSPTLERRLLAHPVYGPHIRAWRERGAVPRRAKWAATIGMSASAIGLQLTDAEPWVRAAVPFAMAAVAVWLWRRPEH